MKENDIYLIFGTQFDVLRARTNQISDMRTCEGFVQNGINANYISPFVKRRDNLPKDSIHKYYGVKDTFPINYLFIPYFEGLTAFIYVLLLMIFSFFKIFGKVIRNYNDFDQIVIFSRSVDVMILSIIIFKKILNLKKMCYVHWSHDALTKWRYRFVYENTNFICATNTNIINDLKTIIKSPKPFLNTYNPISIYQTNLDYDKTELRRQLQLPLDKLIIAYTGKVYIGLREIEYILKSAKELKEATFIITGGKPEVVSYYEKYCEEKEINNVIFIGFLQDYRDVQKYQALANILISYYTTQDHLVEYNLPQKIIEYMATGNVIVTPDYKATQDVLNVDNCLFVEAENQNSLTAGLLKLLKDEPLRISLGKQAKIDVKNLTFKSSAKKIIQLIREEKDNN
ncbi:MAG: glycosyltransferase [Saprospiraceae bacterium]|jgi:glycosyltransferase involved in cell wall biosynthesis|nr:glycosyltransferase [Saprospiraceae bacterium]